MGKNHFIISIIIIAFSMTSYGQVGKPAADFVGVPGPIAFDSKSYKLNWSAHPTADLYKQEYLAAGDNADRFKSMILIDVVTGDLKIQDVVATKVAELKKLKETNPMVNYETMGNAKTGQFMLDFLISQNAPNGTPEIVERNIYRYEEFTDKSGHKGIVLLGISTRSYGSDVTKFLTSLKITRNDLVSKLAKLTIPEIAIKK